MEQQQQLRANRRLATSNLRLLLRYDFTRGIAQFRKIVHQGTEYIWNANTDNIIATIRQTDKTLVRYRATSHYAPTIVSWAESIEAVCLPSNNVGRRHRRIRRMMDMPVHSREQVLIWLQNALKVERLQDHLTRTSRREIDRLLAAVEGQAGGIDVSLVRRIHQEMLGATDQRDQAMQRGDIASASSWSQELEHLQNTLRDHARTNRVPTRAADAGVYLTESALVRAADWTTDEITF